MFKKKTVRSAFVYSLPILFSYAFMGIANGLMMQEAGFDWYYSTFASIFLYSGAMQFMLVSFLREGDGLVTILLATFLINSRQSFYSLSFLDEFKNMGHRKIFMIHTMTDETYAVNCTLDNPDISKKERYDIMFYVAIFSYITWMLASTVGGLIGKWIAFELEGIDFCMTALFAIIFMDQWEKSNDHLPAILGLFVAVVCLYVFGQSHFILASLLITSFLLIIFEKNQ